MANTEEIAQSIYDARLQKRAIAPVRDTHGLDSAEDAYAAQELNTRRYVSEGRRLIGRKIGLTSVAVQQQLGVDEPDFGMVWGDTEYLPGQAIPHSDFMQPKIEAEIIFKLGRELDGERIGEVDVLNAVDQVYAGVEIVDSAIADWDIRLVDTIADNASSGGFVICPVPRRLSDIDLRLCGMVISSGGDTLSSGLGAACLGNPLNALAWLARKMVAVGRPLAAGDIVLSGALGPMVPAEAGRDYLVEIGGFPTFPVVFGK